MAKGTVAKIMDRGYGFIKPEEGDKELFFHANELQGVDFNDLREGDAVTYTETEGQKGPQASEVARVEA